jgi:predicted small secreted protein
MKTFHKKTLAFCFSLAILFTIVGTATASSVRHEPLVTNIGLKQVPYNITGVFTTVSGITCNSTSGAFDANNSGIVYNVTQYDRLFTIGEDVSSSPLFFAIDDKQGTHFFSYGNDGNATFFRSGIIKSDDLFSTKMLTSSGGIATAQAASAVRNGTTAQYDRTTSPNITGTWITAQNSVYQINNQEGNVFTGRVTASGKTTSTRFAGYIDKVDEDGTAKIVILCEKRNLMLGNVNVSTHNITIPYVLYADGRVASSPLTTGEVEWAGTNMSYNVTQKYATVLNSDGITEDTSKQVCLLSVSDASKGRYNLTSDSNNITIIGIAQGDNSFFEYSPKTGLFGGFVKGKIKYDFRGGPDLAEASVNYLNQKVGKESVNSRLNTKSGNLILRKTFNNRKLGYYQCH